MQDKPDIKNLSYEQALTELEKIVTGLETGSEVLENTVRNYERGEALRSHCEFLLKNAESRIEAIQTKGTTIDTKPVTKSKNGVFNLE